MASPAPAPVCPHCKAPRVAAPECPRCGVIYAKAEAREAAFEPPSFEPPSLEPAFERPPHLPPPTPTWDGAAEEARLELKLRTYAIPVALLVSHGIMGSPSLPHMVFRTFLSMWIHESGHAITAWLCGFPAFPGPWLTPVSDTRSPLLALALAGALGFWVYRSWKAGKRGLAFAGLGLLALQLVGTLLLRPLQARALFTFGGDGGLLVLGTALMATLYVGKQSQIHQGWLRWGFLVIGAVAFMDGFDQWWRARTDLDSIPFGENEGVGFSDPTMLTEVYGWSVTQLIHRYVWLGCACLAVIAGMYVLGLLQARREARG